MTERDGGPAFPQISELGDIAATGNGMSMRDWFAGQAIRARWGNGEAMTPEDAAMMAYQLADAMLDARTR